MQTRNRGQSVDRIGEFRQEIHHIVGMILETNNQHAIRTAIPTDWVGKVSLAYCVRSKILGSAIYRRKFPHLSVDCCKGFTSRGSAWLKHVTLPLSGRPRKARRAIGLLRGNCCKCGRITRKLARCRCVFLLFDRLYDRILR